MKHTEGPWRADDGDSRLWGVFAEADLNAICYLAEPKNGEDSLRPEDEANAHLMAASPDLLAACRAYIEAWDGVADVKKMDRALALTRAAIAKAVPSPATSCPNCGGGGIDTITDDVGSTIVQTCEDCLGTGRLPA